MPRLDVLPSTCVEPFEPPGEDDLLLEVPSALWALQQAQRLGLRVLGLRRDEGGGWVECAPELLAEVRGLAAVRQRPGCGGIRTVTYLWGASGAVGAWLLDRPARAPEDPVWPAVLLQAMLRAAAV
ncbi:MAG: hypothetical protein KTR31_18370 [Myxococcales bacterium]|nr:hypothetical protein [Myxococcales bacterium]